MNYPAMITCVLCLVLAILLEKKKDIPLGITCILSAFVICYAFYGMAANKVITSFFPANLVMPLILTVLFISVFTHTGTSKVVSQKLMSVIKGNMKLYPWILFFLSTILYFLFGGGALRYILPPLVFSLAKEGKSHPLMAVSTAYLPFLAGSMNPFIGIDATTRMGIFTDMGLQNSVNVSLVVWLHSLLLITILHLIIYVATGSWKAVDIDFSVDKENAEITKEQHLTLVIMLIMIILFMFPPLLNALIPCDLTKTISMIFNNNVVLCLGILIFLFMGLSNWNNMVKTTSFKQLVMIIGINFLIKSLQQGGFQDLCISFASSVPSWLIPPVLVIIGSLLSFFVSASALQPMMFPIVASLALQPLQGLVYLSCIALGLGLSGISPFSGTGVVFLSTVDPEDRDIYSKYMLRMAILSPIIVAMIVLTGLLNLTSLPFVSWYY